MCENWEEVYNKLKWVKDDDGNLFIEFLTYGGGPSGGYRVYYNGTLLSWHHDWGIKKQLQNHSGYIVMRDDDYIKIFNSEDDAEKYINSDEEHIYYDLDFLKSNLKIPTI